MPISKIVHFLLETEALSIAITQLNKIQTEFVRKNDNPKMRHTTLCYDYENGGLKNIGIYLKITILSIKNALVSIDYINITLLLCYEII